jgi:hypothetical protein
VTRFFEVRVISGVEGMEKPDPAIFRLALDRMGVEPADARTSVTTWSTTSSRPRRSG